MEEIVGGRDGGEDVVGGWDDGILRFGMGCWFLPIEKHMCFEKKIQLI